MFPRRSFAAGRPPQRQSPAALRDWSRLCFRFCCRQIQHRERQRIRCRAFSPSKSFYLKIRIYLFFLLSSCFCPFGGKMKASEQGCRILRGAWRCSEFNVEYNSILRRIQAGNNGFYGYIFVFLCRTDNAEERTETDLLPHCGIVYLSALHELRRAQGIIRRQRNSHGGLI